MLGPQVFSLDVALYVVVGARDYCSLEGAGCQFLKINVLGCLGHHLKDIEELLLLQLDQLFQFSRSYFLVVCC